MGAGGAESNAEDDEAAAGDEARGAGNAEDEEAAEDEPADAETGGTKEASGGSATAAFGPLDCSKDNTEGLGALLEEAAVDFKGTAKRRMPSFLLCISSPLSFFQLLL